MTILVDVDPESVILSILVSGDIDLQGDCLAFGHLEVAHFELTAPARDLAVVHPEVVSQRLLALGVRYSGFERTDSAQQVSVLILKHINFVSHVLHGHEKVLHCLVGGFGSVDANADLVLGVGHAGEESDFVCY